MVLHVHIATPTFPGLHGYFVDYRIFRRHCKAHNSIFFSYFPLFFVYRDVDVYACVCVRLLATLKCSSNATTLLYILLLLLLVVVAFAVVVVLTVVVIGFSVVVVIVVLCS